MGVQLLNKTLVMRDTAKVQSRPTLIDDSEMIPQHAIVEEPKPQVDRFDEIIDMLKNQNIYGESKNITVCAVDVPIEKQIAIDKASTKGLKSEEYKNTSENKLEKLRKLRRGN